jgi:predicted ABC-type ATPase
MVTRGPVPVLWITGPAGAGKSTVSWRLFTELAGSGTRAAFADADQLCMCYPAQPDDPGRDRLRARNAGAVIRNSQAAGGRCVIVSGAVDPALGVLRDLLGPAAVMVCRLRADPGEVARRLAGRQPRSGGGEADAVRLVQEECDLMDASGFADVCVDTTGVPAAQVPRLVRDSCRGWPGFGEVAGRPPDAAPAGLANAAPAELAGPAVGAGGRVLLLCGPAGVGKSTIGFQLYLRCLRAGRTAGYIDLDQIGFLTPPAGSDPLNHRLKAANLAAIWRTYHAAGASHLVLTGPVGNQATLGSYLAALPSAAVTTCRLHASPAELRQRIMTRGAGGSWPQPGDPLRGRPARYLARVARQAAAAAQALDRAQLAALRIDTTGHTAAQAAGLIASATGWPGQPPHRERPGSVARARPPGG